MTNSIENTMAITMFGVDPECLGGISTLTRILSRELGNRPGIDFRYIVTANQGTALAKVSCFIGALRLARQRFGCVRGICHIHMANNASVARACVIIWLAKKYGQRVYLHIHCDLSRIRKTVSPRMKRMIDWAVASSDIIIALGDYLDSYFNEIDYPLERVHVLPNAVECPSENPFETHRSKILFLGNVTEDKGVLDLLDAISFVAAELDDNIVFELCGRDHIDIQQLICGRGLQDKVKYCGIVKPDSSFFSQYLLNVLPSHHEAMPFSLLEASANGVPSVASSVGSIPEIICDGVNGWLVDPHDAGGLAQVLLAVLSNTDCIAEASKNIYNDVVKRYSLDSYVENLIALYDGQDK